MSALEGEEKSFDLKLSLQRFGQFYPIIKSRFGIVDGFHRETCGGTEVREIDVKDKVEHWVLRWHLNEKDKTPEQVRQDKIQCVLEIGNELRSKNPELKGYKLQRAIAEKLGVSQSTVQRYLPDEFKLEVSSKGGLPIEEARKAAIHSTPDVVPSESRSPLDLERDRTRLALAKHYPEFNLVLKQILRNEKPYLATKDKVDRFWKIVSRKGLDPLTAYVRYFYLYEGPGRGWRPELPYWIKLRLEAIGEEEGVSAEALLAKIAGDYTCGAEIKGKSVSVEQTEKRGKVELLKEWLIKEDKWSRYLKG